MLLCTFYKKAGFCHFCQRYIVLTSGEYPIREALVRLDVHLELSPLKHGLWIKAVWVSLELSEHCKIPYSSCFPFAYSSLQRHKQICPSFLSRSVSKRVSNILALTSWHSHTGSDYKHKLTQSAWEETATPLGQLALCQTYQNTMKLLCEDKSLFSNGQLWKQRFENLLYDSPCYLPSINKSTVRASQSLHLQCL